MKNGLERFDEIVDKLKALAHPARLCIVTRLLEEGECNVSFMQNCLKSPQSTISQHLQKLRAAGLISARRQGLEIYYRIKDERVAGLVKNIHMEVRRKI